MATERNDRIGRIFGYFDTTKNVNLLIVKSVEVTDEFPEDERIVVVDYAEATEGIIVYITCCYHGTAMLNFRFSLSHTEKNSIRELCFKTLGLLPEKLFPIIEKEAPLV